MFKKGFIAVEIIAVAFVALIGGLAGTSAYFKNGQSAQEKSAAAVNTSIVMIDETFALDPIIARGTYGGIDWTLTEAGLLTIKPSLNPVADSVSGKVYASGEWREAVVYDKNGNPKSIGGYPYNVNSVKSLVIEEGVTFIGSFAAQFPNLTGEVIIPSTVTYIGQEAFQKTKITQLTFAAGGTEKLCVGPGAFKNMIIEMIAFPEDRPEIHIHCWAFNNSTKLKTVIFPANITTFSKWTHVEYAGMGTVDSNDSQLFKGASSLKTVIFGSQEVRDLFYNSPNNSKYMTNVEVIIQE